MQKLCWSSSWPSKSKSIFPEPIAGDMDGDGIFTPPPPEEDPSDGMA